MAANVSNMSTNNLLLSTQDDGKNIIFEVFARYNNKHVLQLLPALHEASSHADILLASCTISFDKPRGGQNYAAISNPASCHVVSLELPHDNHTLNLSVVALLLTNVETTCLQQGIEHLWIALVYDDWMKTFLTGAGFKPCQCTPDVNLINASQGSRRYCKSPNNHQYDQKMSEKAFTTQKHREASEVFGRGRANGQDLEKMISKKRNAISPPGNDSRVKRRVDASYLGDEGHLPFDAQTMKRNGFGAVSNSLQPFLPPPPIVPTEKKFCTYYIRTGKCRFSPKCVFDHNMPPLHILSQLGFRTVPKWYLESQLMNKLATIGKLDERGLWCRHWIMMGRCDFERVGCKYVHEMPDEEALAVMGINGTPEWFKASGLARATSGCSRSNANPYQMVVAAAQSIANKKIPVVDSTNFGYCRYWIRTGHCDFNQQGCKFLHEIPDSAALHKMGFDDNNLPVWLRSASPQTQARTWSFPSSLPNVHVPVPATTKHHNSNPMVHALPPKPSFTPLPSPHNFHHHHHLPTPSYAPPPTPPLSSTTNFPIPTWYTAGQDLAPYEDPKIYCSLYIRTGECQFTAPGCKYLHDIPSPNTMRRLGFNETPAWLRGRGMGKSRRELEMAARKTERVANITAKGIHGNGMNGNGNGNGRGGEFEIAIRTQEEEQENGIASQVEGVRVNGNGGVGVGAGAISAKEEGDKDEDEDEFMTEGVNVDIDVNVDAEGEKGNGEALVEEKEWEIDYE